MLKRGDVFMQSKVAHAAERKAFGIALDRIIKSASSKDREKNIEHLVNMAGKLMKDTSPGATRGIKKRFVSRIKMGEVPF